MYVAVVAAICRAACEVRWWRKSGGEVSNEAEKQWRSRGRVEWPRGRTHTATSIWTPSLWLQLLTWKAPSGGGESCGWTPPVCTDTEDRNMVHVGTPTSSTQLNMSTCINMFKAFLFLFVALSSFQIITYYQNWKKGLCSPCVCVFCWCQVGVYT